uniref:Uncharacterized protein n=1 Tax=Terrapene triunguis TaxID=2587831 RepID=A0A674HYG3_9SAUR
MGITISCCNFSSPKLHRNAHSQLESYCSKSELSCEDTGCNLQHICDRNNIDGKRDRWAGMIYSLPSSSTFFHVSFGDCKIYGETEALFRFFMPPSFGCPIPASHNAALYTPS